MQKVLLKTYAANSPHLRKWQPQINALRAETLGDDANYPKMWQQSPKTRYVLACQGKTLLGFASTTAEPKQQIAIQELIVREESRLQGVGTRLLARIEQKYANSALKICNWAQLVPFLMKKGFAAAQNSGGQMVKMLSVKAAAAVVVLTSIKSLMDGVMQKLQA